MFPVDPTQPFSTFNPPPCAMPKALQEIDAPMQYSITGAISLCAMPKALQEVDRWIHMSAEEREEGDIRALAEECAKRLIAQPPIHELGPLLAVIYWRYQDWTSTRPFAWAIAVIIWALQRAYGKRPLWNDFHMALWQISRDRRYVIKLHRHLKRAEKAGNQDQLHSAAWMINSVCRQDEEFRLRWLAAVESEGPIHLGDFFA
jgi:hypothetical protein